MNRCRTAAGNDEMDATEKQNEQRKVLKLAAAHFLISLFVFWKLFHFYNPSLSVEQRIWANAWDAFLFKLFILLQPLLVFFYSILSHLVRLPDLGGIGSFLAGLTMLLLVPFWSICFAWLFVKLDHWLNHFPVLGKKVF